MSHSRRLRDRHWLTRRRRAAWLLAVCVVLIVAAFVATTAFVQKRAEGIGAQAASITDNAVPSVEALIALRAGILRVEDDLHDLLAPNPAPVGLEPRITSELVGVRNQLDTYLGTPVYPGELEPRQELVLAVSRFSELTLEVLATAHTDRPRARAMVEGDYARLVTSAQRQIDRIEDISTERIRGFTAQLEHVRKAAAREATLLDGLSVLFAGVLVLLAFRIERSQRAAEEDRLRLLQSRASELEIFASRVAHDIRSPLSSTTLALGALARSSDESVRQRVEQGQGGVNKVLALVDDLLAFARAGARPSPDAVGDVRQAALEVVASFDHEAKSAQVALTATVPDEPVPVPANPGIIASALSNLVQNAIRYLAHAEQRRVEVTVRRDRTLAHVEVRDTGPGIPREKARLIFEPYVRASAEGPGLGLGLATVKRLVESHGGSVGVDSEEGRGATFWFELPLRGCASD